MNRHDFLSEVHRLYRPRTYLEIGVDLGVGLSQSRTRTIGIDPAYRITSELECDLQLVRATSDDFFARDRPLSWFPQAVIDLAFIDGLHIFEAALKDFVNVERHASPNSVIVLDDMLPRSSAEAARTRRTHSWAGDVFRVTAVLERYRPDLIVLPVDTQPTGVLVVLGADPGNRVLTDSFNDIVSEFRSEDPQEVPSNVLDRTDAADPEQVLASSVWETLVTARDTSSGARGAIDAARALRGTAAYARDVPDLGVWPLETTFMQHARGALRRRVNRIRSS